MQSQSESRSSPHAFDTLLTVVAATTFLLSGVGYAADPVDDASAADRGADSPEAAARFERAFEILESPASTHDVVESLDVLRKGYPDSRPIITDHALSGSARVQIYALRILGESGDPEANMPIVAHALKSGQKTVRLAAMMAIQALGERGLGAVVLCLGKEADPSNLRLGVRLLGSWKREEAVPVLVQILERELAARARDRTLEMLCVRALEGITGKGLGSDLGAWKEHLEQRDLLLQAQALIKDLRGPAEPESQQPEREK